jgi:hypothetical protein
LQQLGEQAAEAGAADLRHRLGALQLGVAFDQVLWPDQHGQVHLVADLEEHGADPGQERDHEQLDQRQGPEGGGERDAAEQDGAGEIADHE